MIEGKDSARICATLIEKNLISQLDHAAYLGGKLGRPSKRRTVLAIIG